MNDREDGEPATLEEIDRRYRKTSALLIDRIARRDEMKSLLKIAKPAKIAPLREVIAKLGKIIEHIERELELTEQMRRKRIEYDESLKDLWNTMDRMKPEFLAFIAEHHPEKLEEMELLFSDDEDDDSKTH